MLINFVGAPCSGKTTSAARLFAELKDAGVTSEFVVEQARIFIATRSLRDGVVNLTDQDQIQIMSMQLDTETLMRKVCGPESVVISDSSPLNALLYMTESTRLDDQVKGMIEKAVEQVDVVFICQPVRPLIRHDPNRVHTFEQSLEIDNHLNEILKQFPGLTGKIYNLVGDSGFRLRECMRLINKKLA